MPGFFSISRNAAASSACFALSDLAGLRARTMLYWSDCHTWGIGAPSSRHFVQKMQLMMSLSACRRWISVSGCTSRSESMNQT